MKPIIRRVGRLEDRYALVAGEPKTCLRLIVSLPWKGPANLATSTCTRTNYAGRGVFENVNLDGDESSLSDDDLERFIAGFPIEVVRRSVA